jgi:hypothetical protein
MSGEFVKDPLGLHTDLQMRKRTVSISHMHGYNPPARVPSGP